MGLSLRRHPKLPWQRDKEEIAPSHHNYRRGYRNPPEISEEADRPQKNCIIAELRSVGFFHFV